MTYVLDIDPELEAQLAPLAEREGVSIPELARDVLRSHAERARRIDDELAEDDRRYQRFLKTGDCVSLEDMQAELRWTAAEIATRKVSGSR